MWRRRPDAELVRDVPAYRGVMPLLMPTRTESAVYFEQEVDLARTRAFLAEHAAAHPEAPASLFHVVVWAAVRVLHERPRLNRFVAGGRLWQRDGVWVSWSAKKRFDHDAPIVVLKRRFGPVSFAEVVASLRGATDDGRSDAPSRTDRELRLLGALPLALQRLGVGLVRALDARGLLPRSFVAGDPLFTSLFVANLGSLRMDAAFHHLYEYGSCSIFCTIGRTQEVPVVRDGRVEPRERATLRWSFDERVEDGLYAGRALERIRALVEDPGATAPSDV